MALCVCVCVCDLSHNLVVIFASDATPGLSLLPTTMTTEDSLVCDVTLGYHGCAEKKQRKVGMDCE